MAPQHLTYDDLLRIVELIKSSDQFSEFRLKVGDIEVELRRRNASGSADAIPPRAPVAPPVAALVDAAPAETSPARRGAEVTWPADAHVITAPMVGTFYRAPEPGAAPFVKVGQSVEPTTTVCIVEVMKLMNSVPAGLKGTVLQVLVDDAAPVQAGQPLIVVQPQS